MLLKPILIRMLESIIPKVIFFLFPIFLVSQQKNTPDNFNTIINKDFDVIKKRYYENKLDLILANLYAAAYIKKSKIEENLIELAIGYELMSYVHKNEKGLIYADSIIEMSDNLPQKKYPTKGYLMKGKHYYYQRNFKASLDNYVIAHRLAQASENKDLIHSINHSIGLLKNRAGNYQESLDLFKKNFRYYSSLSVKNNFEIESYYLSSIFALSDAYRRLNKIDSATFFNNLGYHKANQSKNIKYKNYFTFLEGINQYSKKNYDATLDSLTKALPVLIKINNKPNIAYSYSFIGKSFYHKGNKTEGVKNLLKVDQLFNEIKDIHPELRDTYEILINHYKENNNKEKQLEFIEKLLKVDSVLFGNYKYLWYKINKNYDSSNLNHEKEIVIKSLQEENQTSNIYIYVLILLSTTAIIFWFINFKKKKKYKQRFNELLKDEKNAQKQENLKSVAAELDIKTIGFSKQIVDTLLKNLEEFEDSNDFVRSDITISSLAKKYNTNSKYLSKVINVYKKKNFTNYLNDLRINYAIEKLKTDQKFRKYSIKAISESIGYGKAESFSNAFKKRTGIKPSYFIMKLNE